MLLGAQKDYEYPYIYRSTALVLRTYLLAVEDGYGHLRDLFRLVCHRLSLLQLLQAAIGLLRALLLGPPTHETLRSGNKKKRAGR